MPGAAAARACSSTGTSACCSAATPPSSAASASRPPRAARRASRSAATATADGRSATTRHGLTRSRLFARRPSHAVAPSVQLRRAAAQLRVENVPDDVHPSRPRRARASSRRRQRPRRRSLPRAPPPPTSPAARRERSRRTTSDPAAEGPRPAPPSADRERAPGPSTPVDRRERAAPRRRCGLAGRGDGLPALARRRAGAPPTAGARPADLFQVEPPAAHGPAGFAGTTSPTCSCPRRRSSRRSGVLRRRRSSCDSSSA